MKALPPNIPNKLTKLLNEQLRCSKDLLDLSKRQRKAIKSDDTKTMTKILFKKSGLIQEFNEIKELYERSKSDATVLSFRRLSSSSKLKHRDKDKDADSATETNPQMISLVQEMNVVLEELQVVEGECEELLSIKCKEVQDEIDQTKRGKIILDKFSSRPKKFLQSSGLIDENV